MIVVTGGSGLVGSSVVRKLVTQNQPVRVLLRSGHQAPALEGLAGQIERVEGDVLDVSSLEKALAGATYVIHAAAVVSFAPKDRAQLYKVNVEGTANVVNACLNLGIKKLAFVSSVAAIGRPDPRTNASNGVVVLDENQKWEDSPLNSHYAKSKYLAELEVWRGIAEGLSAVIVNPSLILGEGDWHRSSTQLFKYVHDRKPFYTEGYVNYVDVEDVTEALIQLLFLPIQNERFILSGGFSTYQALFERIANSFQIPPPLVRISPQLSEIIWRIEVVRSWLTGKAPLITRETAKTSRTRFVYNAKKIQEAVPNFAFQPLENTVQRVCQFLKNQY